AWTCPMKSDRSLHAVAVCPLLMALSAALSLASRAFCRLLERWSPLTVLTRSLTWAAAPLTVTVKLALTGLFVSSLSLALHVTLVVPMAKVAPEAGVQLTVGAGLSPLSSTAVGGV